MITTAKPEINRATCLIIYEINLTSWLADGIRWKGVAMPYRVYQELVKPSYEQRPVLFLAKGTLPIIGGSRDRHANSQELGHHDDPEEGRPNKQITLTPTSISSHWSSN